MNYKLIVSISVSLLKARLKQTLVAAFGVTFSITMFIALLSFMSGLNDLLDNLILNRTAHIRLYNEMLPTKNQPILLSKEYKNKVNFIRNIKPKQEFLSIKKSKSIIAYLQNDKAVLGVAPKLIVPIYMNVGMVNLSAVINGIDVDAESKLFSFQDYLLKGNVNELKNIPNSVVIGTGLAEKMLVQIGDNIKISTVNNDQFVLKVVGFFQSGIAELDKVQCYTNLETSQKIIGESRSYLTDLQIKLKDINQAPQLSKKYSQLFSVEAIDIQTANAQFETGSSVRTLISYAVGITLLIVAGFGIYNILNMMIYEKMDSIAILKATGFSGKDVNRIFIIFAIIIGVVGGLLGLILGFLVSYLISFIPFETASLPTVKTYPISYIPKFYLIGALFSLITTYFAGYFPSRKASKIDPVDIIRGK
ncbi:MAG: ABC transporter permease [Fluviicola sp.]